MFEAERLEIAKTCQRSNIHGRKWINCGVMYVYSSRNDLELPLSTRMNLKNKSEGEMRAAEISLQ